MRKNLILYVGIIVLLFSSCKQKNRFYLPQFDEEIAVNIKRFDLDFINLDTTAIVSDLEKLESKHPVFFSVFMDYVLMMDTTIFSKELDAPYSYSREIKEFLQDTLFIGVHQDIKETYKDVSQLEQQLSKAYSYLHHYFPELMLPEVYFFASGFNQEILVADSLIGIGTDLYLGADYALYQHITHEYLIPNMRQEMIATDLLKTLLYEQFAFSGTPNLLNSMLYEGKILYLLSVILPDNQAETLIGYSAEELKWSKQHEHAIWSGIIEQKHLYSTDYFLVNQYVNVAPFTAPLTSDSPGRLGVWLGWQIIQHYMDKHTDIDLPSLMQNDNYQQILELSGYRP